MANFHILQGKLEPLSLNIVFISSTAEDRTLFKIKYVYLKINLNISILNLSILRTCSQPVDRIQPNHPTHPTSLNT